jgi:hypothetical protein
MRATSAVAAAMSVNPKSAAIIEITKNTNAHFSNDMVESLAL